MDNEQGKRVETNARSFFSFQLDIFLASTSSRFIILLFIVIICISTTTTHVNGLVNYHDENTDVDLKDSAMADTFFSSKLINADYDHPYGQVHIIPYKKRTIPIELQKALYAHGIVGRRRR